MGTLDRVRPFCWLLSKKSMLEDRRVLGEANCPPLIRPACKFPVCQAYTVSGVTVVSSVVLSSHLSRPWVYLTGNKGTSKSLKLIFNPPHAHTSLDLTADHQTSQEPHLGQPSILQLLFRSSETQITGNHTDSNQLACVGSSAHLGTGKHRASELRHG